MGAAQVTPAVDDARQKGVGDGNFAVDRVFIGVALFGNILKVFGCDFAQGCLSGLFGCSRESLQQEKIADVRLFDRFEGGGGCGIADCSKAVFDFAGKAVVADERVDGGGSEVGSYGAFRAGADGKERGGEKQGNADFHGGKDFISGKDSQKVGLEGFLRKKTQFSAENFADLKEGFIFAPQNRWIHLRVRIHASHA